MLVFLWVIFLLSSSVHLVHLFEIVAGYAPSCQTTLGMLIHLTRLQQVRWDLKTQMDLVLVFVAKCMAAMH